jgi:hypothetical protein
MLNKRRQLLFDEGFKYPGRTPGMNRKDEPDASVISRLQGRFSDALNAVMSQLSHVLSDVLTIARARKVIDH